MVALPDGLRSEPRTSHVELKASNPARLNSSAVVMFVLNTVSHDRRVLKEASSLRAAGYEVTIIGIQLARQPHAAREVTDDGIQILRIPISMAPEPWRPSPRFVLVLRSRLTLRRQRLVRRIRRRQLAIARRAQQIGRRLQREHRSVGTRVRSGSRRLRTRLRRSAIRAWRASQKGLARDRPITRRSRSGSLIAYLARRIGAYIGDFGPGLVTVSRRATRSIGAPLRGLGQPHVRRRAARAARTALWREGAGVRNGAKVVVGLPFRLLFAVWAFVYVGINAASRGQLDWLLNTRYRWTTFSRGAAAVSPPAAIYHGHDFSAIGAALRARRRHGGIVIYDSHELYTEAGTIGKRSRALKWLLRVVEGRAYRESNALVTINATVADELRDRYGSKRTVLVHNCPPRWSPNGPWPDLIREARGIPAEAPVALYQGAFTEVRGLRQMAASILDPRLAHAHLAFLGFGPMQGELESWAGDPRYAGRLHVLPAVPPAELDAWVSSADVSLMPNQPETLNEIVSTPNKLFESIGAGVPVVTSDFPERRRIVMEDPLGPLGAVCNPVDPASIADAILSLVGERGAPPDGREATRRRCLQAAHARWNWERESAALLDLYRTLAPAVAGGLVLAERGR